MQRDISQRKRILILGAGFGGLRLFNKCRKDFEVLLVDRKNYFEYTPEIPACFIKSKEYLGWTIDIEQHAKPGEFLQGSLISAGPHRILIDPLNLERTIARLNERNWPFRIVAPGSIPDVPPNCLEIGFDYSVIAIGAMYPEPIGTTAPHLMARRLQIDEVANSIERFNYPGVSIIGGGYVGVEVACYVAQLIKDYKQDIPVKIYNRGPTICKTVNEKAREAILKILQNKGVQLFVNHPKTVEECQQTGDLTFNCTGTSQQNHKYFQGRFKIGEDKCLFANDFMQVQKGDLSYCPNVFAIGDCVSTAKQSPKLGFIAMMQADYLHSLFDELRVKENKGDWRHLELQPLNQRDESLLPGPERLPDLSVLGVKGFSSVKEPQILTIRLGKDVILVTKKRVFSGCTFALIRKMAYDYSFKALNESSIGKCVYSINQVFGRLIFA